MDEKEAINLFVELVVKKAADIDPDNETHLWGSLRLGFFLGLGFEVNEAEELAYKAAKYERSRE